MNAHLLFKFDFYAWGKPEAGETIPLHEDIIRRSGSVWWGRISGMSRERVEQLKSQIIENAETYAFLYGIRVPKKICPDGILWFRAKMLDVSLTKPKDSELIPEYYRDRNDLELYVRLADLEPIPFKEGCTPRVPGQAAMRHVAVVGKPIPENLVSLDDPEKKICNFSEVFHSTSAAAREPEIHESAISKELRPAQIDLAMRVIDLQEEIILLRQQIDDLKSYKEYYSKILGTDYLFSSEKFFETWIQENMHKIFPELEVIDRQPFASWPDGKFGRLDLLAMNKESKDLAIIEVKTRKRSKKSGYDQFVRYTSWVKRNIEMIKSRYSEFPIQPTINPQFIIITDYIDDEMKAICKDHEITLIYIFGGLGVEKAA